MRGISERFLQLILSTILIGINVQIAILGLFVNASEQGCTAWGRKRIFCGRETVLQNARCDGCALIKMFCYVTVKK